MQYPNDAAESGGDRSGVEALDLAKADAIAVALSYQYPALVGPDFAQLNACWAEIHSYTSSELPDRGEHQNRIQHTCKQLYKLAHDFKGHGGSYGYPLVSLVANLFAHC